MASYNQFNYNYRPAKAVERKLFIELLREIYGVKNDQLTYIGLGSIFFSDFRLLHRELGIKNMVNIEQNEDDKKRFLYNQPYSCIQLLWGRTDDVLPEIDWCGKKIIWLDYDKQLQPYMFTDIETIFSVMQVDSFYFFTCNSLMSRFFNKKTDIHDATKFRNEFDSFTPHDLTPQMLTSSNSPYLIRRMINATIKHVLEQRNAAVEREEDKLVYHQLLFVVYQDGAPMISCGGMLKRKRDIKKFTRTRILALPYVRVGENYLDLEMPVLTNSEIDLVNSHLPEKKNKFLKTSELSFLPKKDLEKYVRIYRYYPSFVEVRDL